MSFCNLKDKQRLSSSQAHVNAVQAQLSVHGGLAKCLPVGLQVLSAIPTLLASNNATMYTPVRTPKLPPSNANAAY